MLNDILMPWTGWLFITINVLSILLLPCVILCVVTTFIELHRFRREEKKKKVANDDSWYNLGAEITKLHMDRAEERIKSLEDMMEQASVHPSLSSFFEKLETHDRK